MENLNNELSELLKFFEYHKNSDTSSKKIEEVSLLKENKKELIDDINSYKDNLYDDNNLYFSKEKYKKLLRLKLIEEYKRYQNYERPYISVLELCGCIRKVYYERCKYEVDINKLYTYPYVYLHQKVGIVIHDCISEVYDFDEIKKKIKSEKYKVKGEVDAIKDLMVFEIKTIKASDFNNTYILKHYYQALLYSYILETEYNYKMKDKICLLYQIKEHLDVDPKSFIINTDFKLAKTLLNRAIILHDCISKKIAPNIFSESEEECKYCLFSNYCKKDNTIKENKLKDNKTIVLL